MSDDAPLTPDDDHLAWLGSLRTDVFTSGCKNSYVRVTDPATGSSAASADSASTLVNKQRAVAELERRTGRAYEVERA